jgi:hypothetical protein
MHVKPIASSSFMDKLFDEPWKVALGGIPNDLRLVT